MALLSDLAPGEVDSSGVYSEGSFNRQLCDRIEEFQQLRRHYAKQGDSEAENDDGS